MLFLFVLVCLSHSFTFEEWVKKHNKHFTTAEILRRRAIFVDNLNYVIANDNTKEYRLSVEGPFASMTNEEYKTLLHSVPPPTQPSSAVKSVSSSPNSFDMRSVNEKNCVTDPRDQGNCGSCYAFATASLIESKMLYKYSDLNRANYYLSPAEIISCAYKYGASGCDGAPLNSAFDYIKSKGIGSESSFPYTTKDDYCKSTPRVAELDSYRYKNCAGEDSCHRDLIYSYKGTVVAFDASRANFQLYTKGIYKDRCKTDNPTHTVHVIGYGVDEEGIQYFIAKNSYGKTWGENGYFRISAADNMCGFSNYVYYAGEVDKA
uniref:Cysteine proteinase 1, putative n=1 Tax=Entamoeba invadens TaxID=33085 RepID=S0B2S7_ENTIV|nr:cysteine proteinase 1 precursor, putative [Entamoeba invadens]